MDALSISTATTFSDKSTDSVFSPGFFPGSNLIFAKNVSSPTKKKGGIKFEGHRGAGLLEPENSLKAFQRGIDLDLDGIELDVWISADGVPIIVHGTDEGIVKFKNSTFDIHVSQIHTKDVKAWELLTGEWIPTLEEVLLLAKNKTKVNIELKEETSKVIRPVLELLVKLDMFEQVCFSSFVHAHKTWLEEGKKELDIKQDLEFGFLVWQNQDFKEYISLAQRGDSLNIDIELLLKQEAFIMEEINKAREKELKIKFYFGFEIEENNEIYKRLEDLKVDTLIINHPLKSSAYLSMNQEVAL
jgi:glycerophosphoryl diester phosphodiesterase